MFRTPTAMLTALLALAVTSLGAAQSATDSTRRDITQDTRAVARDTVKLDKDIAMRDSVSATLTHDRNQLKASEARSDSLQKQLEQARKATPRDSAAIARDEKALANSRKAQERDLDRQQHELALLKEANATVEK